MTRMHVESLQETVLVADLSSEFVEQTASALGTVAVTCLKATSRHDSLHACARHTPQLAFIGFSLIQLGLTAEQLCAAGARQAVAVLAGPNALQSLKAFRAGFELCLYAPVNAADLESLRERGTAYRMIRNSAVVEFP